jgi:hypothetical protein
MRNDDLAVAGKHVAAVYAVAGDGHGSGRRRGGDGMVAPALRIVSRSCGHVGYCTLELFKEQQPSLAAIFIGRSNGNPTVAIYNRYKLRRLLLDRASAGS